MRSRSQKGNKIDKSQHSWSSKLGSISPLANRRRVCVWLGQPLGDGLDLLICVVVSKGCVVGVMARVNVLRGVIEEEVIEKFVYWESYWKCDFLFLLNKEVGVFFIGFLLMTLIREFTFVIFWPMDSLMWC